MVRNVYLPGEIPPAAREPCAPPKPLPDRDITQRETVSWWGEDRANLRACESKRRAAADAIQQTDPPTETIE